MPLTEVKKKVAAYVAGSKKSATALAERADALIQGHSGETVQSWLDDVGNLSQSELKKLGKSISIEFSNDKSEVIEGLRVWAESKGKIKPPDARERDHRQARQLAGNLPNEIKVATPQVAEEVIRQAEILSKDKKISKDVFEAYGKLLGIPVTGTKPSMLKQIKEFANRLARTHGQTQF
jgi:hypothetical protein